MFSFSLFVFDDAYQLMPNRPVNSLFDGAFCFVSIFTGKKRTKVGWAGGTAQFQTLCFK